MNKKIALAAAAIGMGSLAILAVNLEGTFVDKRGAQTAAAALDSDLHKLAGRELTGNEVSRVVKPGGAWLRVSLPASGYGEDAYRALERKLVALGWTKRPDASEQYCKDGATASLGEISSLDSGTSLISTSFEFSGSSVRRCKDAR